MEEIVTVDGRQFRLTIDRPLTASERQQVIADIRKQTGCGTCGSRTAQMRNLSTGMQNMNVPQTPGAGSYTPVTKSSSSTVGLTVAPTGGVGPYEAWFYIIHNATEQTAAEADGTAALIPTGRLISTTTPGGASGVNPVTDIPEIAGTTTRTYTLNDLDVSSATGAPAAVQPYDVDVSTGAILFNATTQGLDAGSIRFITAVADSCTGTDFPGTCAQWVDVATTCVAPTCGFVVT